MKLALNQPSEPEMVKLILSMHGQPK